MAARSSDEDRSVASGRTMEEIAAGKGKAPKPFMTAAGATAGARSASGRVGQRDRARCRQRTPSGSAPEQDGAPSLPDFIEPQLASSVDRPPGGAGLGARDQVRRLPRAAARRRTARRALRTRKGLDWTERFARHRRRPPPACRTASSTARSWRWTTNGRRISPRCRRRCPKARPTAGVLRLRPAARRRRGPAAAAAGRAQGAAAGAAGRLPPRRSIRYVEHFEHRRRRGAALGLPHVAGGDRLQAAGRAVPVRARRDLDQVEVPRRPRGGHRRLDHDDGELPLAARRRAPGRAFRRTSAGSAPGSAADKVAARCCRS